MHTNYQGINKKEATRVQQQLIQEQHIYWNTSVR